MLLLTPQVSTGKGAFVHKGNCGLLNGIASYRLCKDVIKFCVVSYDKEEIFGKKVWWKQTNNKAQI